MELASQEIHHHAGGDMVTVPPNSFNDQDSALLSQEIGTDKGHIGSPCKTQMSGQPQSDNENHRDVNREKPLQGKSFHIGTPVPKGNIND
jgi:hypothetical protein